MPFLAWHFPKLSSTTWSIYFRMFWILGYSASAELLWAAKIRAHHCATLLVNLAEVHESVLLIGHGYLNSLIAQNLKDLGWQRSGRYPRKYWEYCTFSK